MRRGAADMHGVIMAVYVKTLKIQRCATGYW
jgi:hypothetical protein